MELKSKFKKILSAFTAGAISFSLMTGIPFGELDLGITASAAQHSFDVSNGNITINAGTASCDNGQSVSYGLNDVIKITGTTTTNTVTVANGVSVNITLNNVNIDVSASNDTAAFKIEDDSMGNVTITLASDSANTLKSGTNCAGLQKNGDSGSLTINGAGSLEATGGANGAGIGGGSGGNGSNITVSGGTVTATGGANGMGIGGGANGSSSGFSFEGGKVILNGNTEIPSGKSLTIGRKAILEINSGVTLTNNGTIVNNGIINNNGTINNAGNITNNRTINGSISGNGSVSEPPTYDGTPIDIAVGSIVFTDCTIFQGNNAVYKYSQNSEVILKSTGTDPTTNTITVEKDVSANITLDGVNIVTNEAAFKIEDDSSGNVTITLADGSENILKSGSHRAGLQKNGSGNSIGSLTIKGAGSLYAESYDQNGAQYGAGIGAGGKNASSSNITILGGTITAIGGRWAAGIGGTGSGTGSNIIISGGAVSVGGGKPKADAIGGGNASGNSTGIVIKGGSVKVEQGVICNPTDGNGHPVYPVELYTNGKSVSITTAEDEHEHYYAPSTHDENENTVYVYLPKGEAKITLGDGTDAEEKLSGFVDKPGSDNNGIFVPVIEATYGDTIADLEFPYDTNNHWSWFDTDKSKLVGDVGENKFTAVYNESTDNITETVTVKVNPKPITVSADDMSKTYGESDPEFTYTVDENTPLVSGDTLTGELTRETGENARGYKITQGTLTNENNPNYDITFKDGTFTIKEANVNIDFTTGSGGETFTIKNNPTYGDSWEDIITLNNLTASVGSETTTNGFSLVQTGKPDAGENTFKIVFNGTLGGKKFTDVEVASGTVHIAKAEVTITADSFNVTVDDEIPAFTYTTTGLVNNEQLPFTPNIECSADTSTVGEYVITVSGDKESANYKFSYVNGKLTVSEKPVVAAPVITPSGGTFSGSQAVTITCDTEDADVYYTTDGNDPTITSTKYEGAFTVSKTTTVKAIAVKDGMTDSAIVSATFTKESSGDEEYRPSRPFYPEYSTKIKNPIVYGEEISWYEVSEIIRKLDTGSELLVDLNGNTTVPAYVILDIANKDAFVTFRANNTISFVVDGSKIDGNVSVAIDLTVGTSRIKLSETNFGVIGGTAEKQFALSKIGIHAKIGVALDKKYAGKFASLMKFNHETRKYKFVSVAKIGADGKALVDINGRGDYLLIIDSETKMPGDFNNDMITNAEDAVELSKSIVYVLSINEFKADYNGDGKVNAIDASEILKVVVGLVSDKFNLLA